MEITATTVAQGIRGNYRISSKTPFPVLATSRLLHILVFHPHFPFKENCRSGGWQRRLWSYELKSLSNKNTSTHGYLQKNTEEMDLLSSPDATHRDKKIE